MDGDSLDLAGLEQLAAQTEPRAELVRQHAARARGQAGRDSTHGDDEAARVHRQEAEAHERAATAIAQADALYRRRVRYLSRTRPA